MRVRITLLVCKSKMLVLVNKGHKRDLEFRLRILLIKVYYISVISTDIFY